VRGRSAFEHEPNGGEVVFQRHARRLAHHHLGVFWRHCVLRSVAAGCSPFLGIAPARRCCRGRSSRPGSRSIVDLFVVCASAVSAGRMEERLGRGSRVLECGYGEPYVRQFPVEGTTGLGLASEIGPSPTSKRWPAAGRPGGMLGSHLRSGLNALGLSAVVPDLSACCLLRVGRRWFIRGTADGCLAKPGWARH
jgi:hypothetical protein